ncbi:ribosomal-protein-alanine N-acetyltransferase [Thermoplasmatales archaeon]|nr:ribosomal-protein-alanine N-acetyltransferase [Thermoplasmatales archaeon]
MILRHFNIEDLAEIKRLENEAFTVGPYSKRMLRRIFTAPVSFNVIAEEEKTIMGYAVAMPLDQGVFDIESIAVHPNAQKKGIGSILIVEIEKQMKAHGGKVSILEVRDRNDSAIKFYKDHGYEVTGHLENYYSLKHNESRGAYRMAKQL